MTKSLKSICHIYYPEADTKGKSVTIAEAFYINSVLRDSLREKNFSIKHYGHSHESTFKKAIRDKKQNEDLFFIIFDTDYNNDRELEKVIQDTKKLSKTYIELKKKYNKDLEIIISSRCFETYLCMYGRDFYTKPYEKMSVLIQDINFTGYNKSKKWFETNTDDLKGDLGNLISKIELSRRMVFDNNECPFDDYNNPDLTEHRDVAFLAGNAPYTYFDILLKKVL